MLRLPAYDYEMLKSKLFLTFSTRMKEKFSA